MDRHSSNLKAERVLQHRELEEGEPKTSKHVQKCEAHIMSQCSCSMNDLLSADISGMLSVAMSQQGSGALQSLQAMLTELLLDSLQICYEGPPRDFVRLRTELHDLLLPLQQAPGRSLRTTLCRRHVLATMLNGDLNSDTVTHYCGFNCCASVEQTQAKMRLVAWALLPSKAPRFARNRWLHQEQAVEWNALLMTHHNLLPKLLQRWRGQSAATSSQAAMDPDCAVFLEDMPPEPAEEIQREAEEADNAEEADATSWVARNKAFRRNAATWSLSNPASRLVILKSCMAVTASLIHRCLQIGSSEWEAEQELKASRGQARSYRILEAASLHDLKDFFAGMFRLLLQPPRGLAREQLNSQILVLLFRMVSRAVCAMHQLLRRARRSYPYKLFTAMTENCYPNDPSCLHDELTAQFKAWFPEFNADASVHMQAR